MYNEQTALKEIAGLSHDARSHLQDLYRNQLQALSGMLEFGEYKEAKKMIARIDFKLREMGL